MKTIVLSVSFLILALAILVGVVAYTQNLANASVPYGNEYQAVYITSADANATTSIKTVPGSVGSVVITEAGSGGDLVFYATTTDGQQQATSTNDILFVVDGAAGEGTYEYDVAFGYTLMLEAETGYNGQATITFR